jgi:undecaprenyl-diphosphatase
MSIRQTLARPVGPFQGPDGAEKFHRVRQLDRVATAATVRHARDNGLQPVARGFSKLGNGAIYPLLGISLLLVFGGYAWRIIVPALVACAVLHFVYPVLKRRFARARPFVRDPALEPLLPTLDEHSFPSGHAMTLSAVLVLTVAAIPALLWPAVIGWLLMAWSRVATAHHYPTDVIAGTILGVSGGAVLSSLMSVAGL